MRKLLRPKDYILLTLGLLGDVFEEMKDPFSLRNEASRYLYGWVPERWKRHNFERAVYRMLKTGDIERVIVKGKPMLKLTSAGRGQWSREFSLFKLADKPWDGKWRMISYDIPDQYKGRRDSLREKVERLGMGRLQESLFITPYDFTVDLREFIEAHELSSYIVVFEARHTFGGSPRDLAWRVWKLDKLDERYNELLKLTEKETLHSKEEKFQMQVKLEEILLDDPLLPKELLPSNWIGFKVRKSILGF